MASFREGGLNWVTRLGRAHFPLGCMRQPDAVRAAATQAGGENDDTCELPAEFANHRLVSPGPLVQRHLLVYLVGSALTSYSVFSATFGTSYPKTPRRRFTILLRMSSELLHPVPDSADIAWRELDGVLDEIAQLVKSEQSPTMFHAECCVAWSQGWTRPAESFGCKGPRRKCKPIRACCQMTGARTKDKC